MCLFKTWFVSSLDTYLIYLIHVAWIEIMSETLFLKNIFFILLKHIKIDLIFLLSKTFFFLYYHKTDLIFFKSKDLVLCDKHMSEFFYLQKPLFSTYHKTDLVFWQIKINFFSPIKTDRILFKRRDFTHK